MRELPRARTENVISEQVNDELVVYDLASQMAHALSAAAASVWARCDGLVSPAEIAQALGLAPVIIEQALDELHACGLLDEGHVPEQAYSRRQAVTRAAKVGGTAFAAPLIYSVVVGSAAMAASCLANGQPEQACGAGPGKKGSSTKCCSGTCYHTAAGAKTCVEADCVQAGGLCVLGLIPCCAGPGTCTGVITLTCST